MIEIGNTSPSSQPLGDISTINATGSHQRKGKGGPLWRPWWGGLGRWRPLCSCSTTGETRAQLRVLRLLDATVWLTSYGGASCVSVLSLDQSSLIVWFPYRGKMWPSKTALTAQPSHPPSIRRAVLIWWTKVFHQRPPLWGWEHSHILDTPASTSCQWGNVLPDC